MTGIIKRCLAALLLLVCIGMLAGCSGSGKTVESGIFLNGRAISFAENGDTELELLSVENGITVETGRFA